MPYTLRLRTAVVPAAHYYRFVDWILQQPQVGGQLIIEGTSQASAPAHIRTTTSATAVTPAAAPEFKAPSRKGLIGRRQHIAFIDWLALNCPPKQPVIATAAGKKSTATPPRIQAPTRSKGRLLTSELQAFAAAVSKKYQLDIRLDQFESVREVAGHGLLLRRKRGPLTRNLRIEIQLRTCTAIYCAPFQDAGVAYTKVTSVEDFENGTVTETWTQSEVGPHFYPEEGDYTCPGYDVDTNFDPEFEYGPSEGPATVTYSDPVGGSAALLPLSLAHLAVVSTTDAFNEEWTGTPPTPADIDLGHWSTSDPAIEVVVSSYRYRFITTGPGMHLEWNQGGDAFTLDLPTAGTSDWYDDSDWYATPPTEGFYDAITDLVIN